MFARTARLMLRPGWPEDATELARAIGHEDVAMRLSRVPWPYRDDDAHAWLAATMPPRAVRWLILDSIATAPRIIGGISLIPGEDGLALGYWLTPSVWGHGYATEAGRAVVDFARHALPVDRLVSSWHVDNPASGAVLAKLGFRSTGTTRMRHSLAQRRTVETALAELDLGDASRTEPDMPLAA